MDIRQIRQVLAIQRHGSFARAADELGISQPAMSKSIARLEDELGLRLFDRSGAGARATPTGELVVERAERIISEAEQLQQLVELTSTGRIGRIRVGLGPVLHAEFLPRYAEALARRWPELKISIDVDRRDRLIEDIKTSRYDIVIHARAEELLGPDFVVTEVLREPALVVASPDHPLAALEEVPLDLFLSYPTGGASPDSMLTAQGSVLTPAVETHQENRIECNDERTLKLLAKQGLITLFTARHTVWRELEEGQLVPVKLGWRMTMQQLAVTRRAVSHSPIVREAVAIACRIGVDLGGLGRR